MSQFSSTFDLNQPFHRFPNLGPFICRKIDFWEEQTGGTAVQKFKMVARLITKL